MGFLMDKLDKVLKEMEERERRRSFVVGCRFALGFSFFFFMAAFYELYKINNGIAIGEKLQSIRILTYFFEPFFGIYSNFISFLVLGFIPIVAFIFGVLKK